MLKRGLFVLIIFVFLAPINSSANEATLVFLSGNVWIKPKGSDKFEPAKTSIKIATGSTLKTDYDGRAQLLFSGGIKLWVGVSTVFEIAKNYFLVIYILCLKTII